MTRSAFNRISLRPYLRPLRYFFLFKSRRTSLLKVLNNAPVITAKSLFFSLNSIDFFSQKILSYFLGFFLRDGLLASHLKVLYFIFSRSLLPSQKSIPFFFAADFALTPLNLVTALATPMVNFSITPLSAPHSPLYFFFKVIASSIALTYRVAFVGLSRRLRKIVKNKYRFRRQYVCVFPSSRLRYGFHLIRFCLKFIGGKTKADRLLTLITPLTSDYTASPVYQLRYQQQKHVLSALRKQYLLS